MPGPTCYGRGGTEPTVTDANLVLGRLDPDRFLGGRMTLDVAKAKAALESVAHKFEQTAEELASGILKVATINMANAVRKVTLERGFDPRDFAMVAFGGAGPLHAAAVAREIGMHTVIIPPQPGHFSAYGMLFADFRYDLTSTIVGLLDTIDLDTMDARFLAMEEEGAAQLRQLGLPLKSIGFTRYAEMRYRRQEYTIKVRLPDDGKAHDRAALAQMFEDAYQRRYGHSASSMEIEIVTLRIVVDGRTARPDLAAPASPGSAPSSPGERTIRFDTTGPIQARVWQRATLSTGDRLAGPGVVEEDASTTVLGPSDVAVIDEIGNIVITLGADE